MIPAELFQTIYLVLLLALTIPVANRYFHNNLVETPVIDNDKLFAITVTGFVILFVGLRPLSPVFGDMIVYYNAIHTHHIENTTISLSGNYLYIIFMSFLSFINVPPKIAILSLAFINFYFTFIAIKKLFPNDILAAMLVFFASFSTFAYATNGLKAGCAAALFLCALAYRDNWKVFIPFLIASFGFHHSMELPIVAFICCHLYKNTNFYIILWLSCLLLAATHVTFFQNFFANFTDEHGAGYLLGENYGGRGGFRLDFILYSAVPIIIRQYLVYNQNYTPSKEYTFLFNVYILSNAIWLLCMYAKFSNRIAYLSWCIYPIVLIYPFLKGEKSNEKSETFPLVLLGNLVFTLFMTFVYA